MKKALLLLGVLLFLFGSILLIGAYFIFNRYSLSDSHSISIVNSVWLFPESPLELHEEDKIIVRTLMIGGRSGGIAYFYFMSTAGAKDIIGQGGNSTFYYYVPKNGLYYCVVEVPYGSFQQTGANTWLDLTVTLNIEIVSKAPNLLFLLLGIVLLLGSVITILTAFLYQKIERRKINQEANVSHQTIA
jgi:hypothetical protein